jgi:adenylate cyclase
LRLIQSQGDEKGYVDIPVDTSAMALVPFRGRPGPEGSAFRYISASDLLLGKLPPLSLQGKAVFVGTTAPGLLDVRITPVSKAYPGVEVHANLLSGMLDNTIATSPSYRVGYELCLLLLLSACLMLILPRVAALNGALVAGAFLFVAFVFNWFAYTRASLVLPFSSGLALILTTYFSYLAYAYFVESKAKRQITRLFGTYVPPELVDEMARDPEQYSLAAQSKEMTVMFCDIRDFTRLSETMSPTQLSELVNQVFSVVTEVVQAHRGTLDKYLGDAVMAFWGAPVPADNHAELAVKAALAIDPAIQALNIRNRLANLPEISLGIGVNTGTMFVGDMGSNVRRAYTVVGDAVNLASRLEGLTRLYAVNIICGEVTRQQCDMFNWRELDTVRVKGKLASVTLFEPLSSERAKAESSFSALYAELLVAYRQQNWGLSESLLSRFPADRAALWRLFTQRLANLRASPPPAGWDGSTRLDSK